MSNLLFRIFAFFFHLLRDVIHFVRFGRPARTFSMPPARPQPSLAPQPSPQSTPRRDPMAELAQLKAENRATMREVYAHRREMKERRRLEREAARARGELPPAKPRKPREPKPKALSEAPPKALPEAPPAATAAPPAIPLRPTPSQATPSQAIQSDTTPRRALFKALSRLVAAPLRIVKTALLAFPRLIMGLFSHRRPSSSGPPRSLPAAPPLQNRAA